MSPQYMQNDRSRMASFALVAAAHVLCLYLMMMHAPTRAAMTHATGFMVTLIREQPNAESKPTELPKPMPAKLTISPPVPVPIPFVATTVPADITAPPPPQPLAKPVRPAQIGPTQVTAVVPPRFDADYLDNPAPVYPRLSKRLGEVGNVMLMVFVDADGRPGQIDIQTSSRYERLDQAAVEAVRRWKFLAAKQGERAVAAWVLVPIYFSLRS